jgi:opacity protein-like surface antigen
MSGTIQPRALLLRCFLAGTSLIVLTGSTLAADLPVRKAPPPAVMASWAGFYLGAHGGYGWKRDDFSEPATVFFSTTPQTINGIRSKGAGARPVTTGNSARLSPVSQSTSAWRTSKAATA